MNKNVTDVALRRPGRCMELKRRQATAVVLMGVLGAEFGQDADEQKKRKTREGTDDQRLKSTVEGFAIGANQNLARLTSLYSFPHRFIPFIIYSIIILVNLFIHSINMSK